MTRLRRKHVRQNALGRELGLAFLFVLGLSGSLASPASADHAGWGWGAPVRLATDNSVNYSSEFLSVPQLTPQIVAYGEGNAIAVWSQRDGARYTIWGSRYSEETGWEIASRIGTGAGDAFNTRIDADAQGNAIVIWELWDGNRTTVWANRYVDGAGWGTPRPIEDAVDTWDAQVAVDFYGNAIAVWRERVGTNDTVWASRYVVGVGWGDAAEVGTTEGGASLSKIALDYAFGGAVVVWEGDAGIWANRYDWEQGWGSPTLIGPLGPNVFGTNDPEVHVDDDRSAIVVWSASGPAGGGLSNRFLPGMGWEGVTLVADRTGDAWVEKQGYDLQFVTDSRGNALVVWAEWNRGGLSGPSDISSSQYIADRGWQPRVLLCCEEVASVGYPQIAVDPNGNAVVVWWRAIFDGGFGLGAKRYVVGEGWDEATYFPVSSIVGWGGASGKVAADSAGNAYVVWQSVEGDQISVWANQYAPQTIPPLPPVPESILQELAFVRSIALAALAGLLALVVAFVALFRVTRKRWPGSTHHSTDKLDATELNERPNHEVAPLQGNALAAIALERLAEKRWPTQHAVANGVRLIAKERVLLHLLHFARYADAPEVPPELTQERTVEATGINRRHFAQYVRPLIQEGLVRERSAHVRGSLQRRKIYVPTDEGRRKAMEIRDRIRSVVIRMRDASGEREVTIAEALLEARGSMSILDMLREAIETGVVDLRH